MEKLLMIFVLCVAVRADEYVDHPKNYEDHEVPPLEKVSCSPDSSNRSALIEDAKCGAPRDVFVVLKPRAAHEEMHPSAVWVKRCVGLCNHVGPDGKCMPRKTTVRHIPINTSNMKTGKESCSLYPVEEHLSCRCCKGSPESCAVSGRVFNPRKCSCQCPYHKERHDCLAKRDYNSIENGFGVRVAPPSKALYVPRLHYTAMAEDMMEYVHQKPGFSLTVLQLHSGHYVHFGSL